VPVEWVGHELGLRVEAERVVVEGPDGTRIEHRRRYGRGEMSLELDHYLPLLARKHRGLDRAVPVRRFLEREDPRWRVLLAELRRRDGEVVGSKAFVDVLFLCREWGVAAVTEAVGKALRRVEVSLGLVRFYLWNGVEQERQSVAPLDYPGPAVRLGSVADYAGLLTAAEVAHD
jgi:hypothetical protein